MLKARCCRTSGTLGKYSRRELQDRKRYTWNTAVLGGRLALVSDANIAGKTIVTYNVHLESRGDELTGDFNTDVSQGLQLVQSPVLSFRTHSRTTTSQRNLAHFWSTDGRSIGIFRVVVFAAANLMFIVRFRLATIIGYPSICLSSAIQVPKRRRRASAYGACRQVRPSTLPSNLWHK